MKPHPVVMLAVDVRCISPTRWPVTPAIWTALHYIPVDVRVTENVVNEARSICRTGIYSVAIIVEIKLLANDFTFPEGQLPVWHTHRPPGIIDQKFYSTLPRPSPSTQTEFSLVKFLDKPHFFVFCSNGKKPSLYNHCRPGGKL